MLGELYQPKGLALETARAVLEVDNPWAVNVAWGCRLGCKYPCYNWFRTKGKMTFPKEPVVDLVRKQLEKGLEPKPEGVFISFGTEPLLEENWVNTWHLVSLLREYNIKIAILSKVDVFPNPDQDIRQGMTIVSLSHTYDFQYEPGALSSEQRVRKLKEAHGYDHYTWVSVEPYPCPAIFKQDLKPLLEQLDFVNFMIFGKWNYDNRANTPEAKEFYKQAAEEFVGFCKAHGIRYHVKSDTGGVKKEQ